MIVENIYFAVPSHYTIGRSFATYHEAHRCAVGSIRTFDGIPGESRAFVDVRVAGKEGDHLIHRTEVFSGSRNAVELSPVTRR